MLLLVFCFSRCRRSRIERQPNSDYHARREALAKKVDGVVVLFAATENEGPNDLYGFRQDDNFYYLSGLSEPGAALLIAAAAEAKDNAPARAYTEILFLPPRNLMQEKWTGPKLGAENPEAPEDYRLRPGGRYGAIAQRSCAIHGRRASRNLQRCRFRRRTIAFHPSSRVS